MKHAHTHKHRQLGQWALCALGLLQQLWCLLRHNFSFCVITVRSKTELFTHILLLPTTTEKTVYTEVI